MKNIKNWLAKKGYEFKEIKMQDGKEGLMLSFSDNTVDDLKKSIKIGNEISKYINKYHEGFKAEFRGNYTGLIIY